jgi:hypothetical protein
MPTASRNTRKKARLKRTTSLLRRELRELATQNFKTTIALITVLAQKGDITVTQGTIEQVTANIDNLGFQVVPGENANEFTLRLVSKIADSAPSPVGELPADEPVLEPPLITLTDGQ